MYYWCKGLISVLINPYCAKGAAESCSLNALSGLWYDWLNGKLASDWLKSTTDPRGKRALPGKSQKHTHTNPSGFVVNDDLYIQTLIHFKHSKVFVHSCISMNCVLHLWNVFYEYIILFCACELLFCEYIFFSRTWIFFVCTWIRFHACEIVYACVNSVFLRELYLRLNCFHTIRHPHKHNSFHFR